MATIALLGSATFTTASGTKTVTATPAVGDLIVIITAHTGNTSAATPTDTQGGTYVTVATTVKASSADTMMVHIRTARIPAASSTDFSHAPGSSSGGGLAVLAVTGMSRVGASAARLTAIADNRSAGTTPQPTFGGPSTTGTNPMVGAVFNASNVAGMTKPASFDTEEADVGYNSPTTGLEVVSDDTGYSAGDVAWGSTSASAFCVVAVELDASATPTLPVWHHAYRIWPRPRW